MYLELVSSYLHAMLKLRSLQAPLQFIRLCKDDGISSVGYKSPVVGNGAFCRPSEHKLCADSPKGFSRSIWAAIRKAAHRRLGVFFPPRYLLADSCQRSDKKKCITNRCCRRHCCNFRPNTTSAQAFKRRTSGKAARLLRTLDASRGWALLIAATGVRSERKHATYFLQTTAKYSPPRDDNKENKETKTRRKLFTDAASSLIPFSTPNERCPFFKHSFTTLLVFETLQGPGQAALICAFLCA